MEKYCQSCSMPLSDPELAGTEANGTKSQDYCKYCYQNGSFTHPDLTLEEMKERVMQQSDKEHLPNDIVEAAVSRLPSLKRWKKQINPASL